MRAAATLLALHVLLALAAGSVAAQDSRQLRNSRMRLDSIRQQRSRLEQEMETLRSRVRSTSSEVENIARRRTASAAAVLELELQYVLLGEEVERSRLDLDTTRQRLADRTAVLHARLRSIYKRGELHTVRVLLGAEDFGDLLNRYKYLHLIALQDRAVVEQVRRLTSQLAQQQERVEQALRQLELLREEKNGELARLERLEGESQRALVNYRVAEAQAETQLDAAEAAENQLTALVAQLERERRDAESRRLASSGLAHPASISTRDLGALDWPVDGEIIYRFGPERKPTGVTLVNKGIGIAAAPGTPVRAVEAGLVAIARVLEGSGATVMVDHGGGYYTLYMYLATIDVSEDAAIAAGHVVGTVGGEQTPEGAHLYFQVRAPLQPGVPEAVDPLTWLRSRER